MLPGDAGEVVKCVLSALAIVASAPEVGGFVPSVAKPGTPTMSADEPARP